MVHLVIINQSKPKECKMPSVTLMSTPIVNAGSWTTTHVPVWRGLLVIVGVGVTAHGSRGSMGIPVPSAQVCCTCRKSIKRKRQNHRIILTLIYCRYGCIQKLLPFLTFLLTESSVKCNQEGECWKEKRNYKFTVVKSAKLLTVHQEGLLTLLEQPSKIIPSLPTQGSIKNVSEKETFSSRSPLTLKMQHTLNFVGRPQYGLIPQSRVPWLNFLTKLVFWVSENMNFSRWFGSLIPKSRSCHSVSEGVWRPQLALVNWPTGLTPAQCSRGVCVCVGCLGHSWPSGTHRQWPLYTLVPLQSWNLWNPQNLIHFQQMQLMYDTSLKKKKKFPKVEATT